MLQGCINLDNLLNLSKSQVFFIYETGTAVEGSDNEIKYSTQQVMCCKHALQLSSFIIVIFILSVIQSTLPTKMSLQQTHLKSGKLTACKGGDFFHVYIINTPGVLRSYHQTIHVPSKHGVRNYGDSRKGNSIRIRKSEIQIPALPTHWLWNYLLQEGLGYGAVTNIAKTQGLTTMSCSHYKPTINRSETLLPNILPPEPRLMELPPPEMPSAAWAVGEDEALTFYWLQQIPKEVQSYLVPWNSTKKCSVNLTRD